MVSRKFRELTSVSNVTFTGTYWHWCVAWCQALTQVSVCCKIRLTREKIHLLLTQTMSPSKCIYSTIHWKTCWMQMMSCQKHWKQPVTQIRRSLPISSSSWNTSKKLTLTRKWNKHSTSWSSLLTAAWTLSYSVNTFRQQNMWVNILRRNWLPTRSSRKW